MFLSISCLLMIWTILVDGISQEVCSIYNGARGIPIGTNRMCSVADMSTCCKNSSIARTAGNCYGSECEEYSCPGFVGMNLTYKCFEGALLYIYKDEKYQYLNGSSVNYDLLLPEHAGLYECRDSSGHTLYSHNITVNEEIRIGSVDGGCSDFGRYSFFDCCKVSSAWSVLNKDSHRRYTVYGNPTEVNVTVQQLEWLVEKETRNDVDIGLYVERDSINPVIWKVKMRTLPLKVTLLPPRVFFRVIANNTNSSHTICDTVDFSSESNADFLVNTSLPKNATVSQGKDALFQCAFSYSQQNWNTASQFIVKVEIKKSFIEENKMMHTFCSGQYSIASDQNHTNCSLTSVTRKIQSAGVGTIVEFNIPISKIPANLTGASVTCLLVHENSPPSIAISISLTVPLILIVLVVLIAVGVPIFICNRRKHHTNVVDHHDEDPLTSYSSEPSTPVEQHDGRILSLEISEGNGPQTCLMVGERAPEDFGTSDNSNFEMSNDIVVSRARSKTNLIMDVYNLSEFTEFVVYVSYTDQWGEWVRNTLKPLIESLHPVIRVDIHEDMIPGFSVSDERYRLILGADKIVIVVCSKYASSEWCVYELEHAIHQKPALCNGRIIPILTEISNALPRIINGVVCLSMSQDDFRAKLKQAIFKKPNSTQ